MSSSSDKSNIGNQITSAQSTANTGYNNYLGTLQNQFTSPGQTGGSASNNGGGAVVPGDGTSSGGGYSNLIDQAQGERDNLNTQLNSLSTTGGLSQADIDKLNSIYSNPSLLSAISGGGGGGGGGLSGTSAFAGLNFNNPSAISSINLPDYANEKSGYGNFASTGGVDLSALSQGINSYQQLNNPTGGLTQDQINQVQRQSLLDQEQTGGYDPSQISRIQAQAASNAPSFYNNIKGQLANQNAITGNLGAAGAVNFKLARQSAQQEGADRLNANIGLDESIRTGKNQAASELSQSGLSLDQLESSNRLNAIGGIQQGNFQNQGLISSNELSGLAGLTNIDTSSGQLNLQKGALTDQYNLGQGQLQLGQAGGLDNYKIAGAQLGAANNANSAQLALELAGLQGSGQQFIMGSKQQGTEAGLAGLQSLYTSDNGPLQDYYKNLLSGVNSQSSTNQNLIGLGIANNSANKSQFLQNFLGGLGSAGAAVTAFGGGGA